MFGMSMTEIMVILGIALIILGPEKLPKMARTVGKWVREFRRVTSDLRAAIEADEIRESVQEQVQRERKRPTPPDDPYKRAAAEDRALRENPAADDERFAMYDSAALAAASDQLAQRPEPVPLKDPEDPYADEDDDEDERFVARPWDYGPPGAVAAHEHDDEDDDAALPPGVTAVPLPANPRPDITPCATLPPIPVALLDAITAVTLRGGLPYRTAPME